MLFVMQASWFKPNFAGCPAINFLSQPTGASQIGLGSSGVGYIFVCFCPLLTVIVGCVINLLLLCWKLFRQVAAALPGMDQSDQMQKDGILFVEYLLI